MKHFLKIFLVVASVALIVASGLVGGCDTDRASNSAVLKGAIPHTLIGERARVSPQAKYVGTVLTADSCLVDVYRYKPGGRMHMIAWQSEQQAISFDVWPEGDSVSCDPILRRFGHAWEVCIAGVASQCVRQHPNFDDDYDRCIIAGMRTCDFMSTALNCVLFWCPAYD